MEPIQTETFFGSRYVPLSVALDRLGGTVEWDNVAKRATVHVNGKTILVAMESTNVEVNGQIVTVSEVPLVKDGTLYVPEDFFPNVIGQSVTLA